MAIFKVNFILGKSPFRTDYWDSSDDPSKAVKRIPRYTKLNVIEY